MLPHLVVIVFKSVFRVCMTVINYMYFGYLRPFVKRILHRFTGQCEIERILSSGKLTGAARIRKLEFALSHSKRDELKNVLTTLARLKVNDEETLVNLSKMVADVKGISEEKRRQWFEMELTIAFRMIAGYKFLIDRVEEERSILYDSTNPDHEELLLKLWSLLKPDVELTNRVCNQWTEIGFQGDDPATDFRGMGVLGLRQLVFFSEYQSDRAGHLLAKSAHPSKGYPFAIVGISMTALARDLLREGALRNHFFNTMRRGTQLEDFHRTYCELFNIFDCFWTKMNPASIMEFVPIRHQLHNALRSSLSCENVSLQESPLSQ